MFAMVGAEKGSIRLSSVLDLRRAGYPARDRRFPNNGMLLRDLAEICPRVDAAAVTVAEDQAQALVTDRTDVVQANVRGNLGRSTGAAGPLLAAAAAAPRS